MFSSISLFYYLDRSWDTVLIHSHCNVVAPPLQASLKSKPTFHCSLSRQFESEDESDDTAAAKDNSGKKGPMSRQHASLMAKRLEFKSTKLAEQWSKKRLSGVNAALAIKSSQILMSSEDI